MGKVYLIGAGPGDIELITVKALKLIQKADVIVYDRLVNIDILRETKKEVELIYVGKKNKNHTISQDEINEILYQKAINYDIVVRLKGGDPFVFGRGAEEAIFLKKKGIKSEIVPGITSAISVPAYAGIPVTYRGISSSFRVVAGNQKEGSNIQINWNSFKENETIIFLMGYHRLSDIVSNLLKIGKNPGTLVAVISKGTTKKQKVVVGTLDTICRKVLGLQTPVLIIIGDVVKLREYLKWYEDE